MAHLSDTFTDVDNTDLDNHLPEVGGSWFVTSGIGNCRIQNNRGAPVNTAPTLFHNDSDPGVDNYFTQLDTVQITDTNWAGPAVRIDPENINAYYIGHGSTEWQITRLLGGVGTTLGAWKSEGKTATLRLEADEGEQRLYVNEILRITTNDLEITARGFSGFRQRGGSLTSGIHVDNIIGDVLAGEEEEPLIRDRKPLLLGGRAINTGRIKL